MSIFVPLFTVNQPQAMTITAATVVALTNLAATFYGREYDSQVYLPKEEADRLYKNCQVINKALTTDKGQAGVIRCYDSGMDRFCYHFPCPNGEFYFSLESSNGHVMLKAQGHDKYRHGNPLVAGSPTTCGC